MKRIGFFSLAIASCMSVTSASGQHWLRNKNGTLTPFTAPNGMPDNLIPGQLLEMNSAKYMVIDKGTGPSGGSYIAGYTITPLSADEVTNVARARRFYLRGQGWLP